MDRETIAYEIIQQITPDKADEKGMSIPQLHKLLELSSKTEQIPVFIIDDADKLPVETLEFVLELSALKYQDTCFHFVLFANEAITDKLNSGNLIELSSQLVSNVHLPSLSLTQLKEYIDNRLDSSGEINEYPFTEEDIKEIYSISAGLPKGVNILARQKMLAKITPNEKSNSMLMISIAAIIAIAVVSGFYLTNSPDQVIETIPSTAVAPPQPATQPVAPPPVELTVSVQDEVAAEEVEEINNAPSETDEIPEVVSNDTSTRQEIEGDTSASLEMGTTMLETDADSSLTENAAVAELSEEIQEAETLDTTAPEDDITTTVEQPVTELESAQPVVVADSSMPSFNPPADNAVVNTDNNIFKLDSIPEQLRGLKGENWYREQPRSSYSLQLISASSLDNALTLLDGLEDFHEDISGYVKYTPSGRPRYLLFFGHHPDRDAASNSSSSTPEKLRAITPYPRSIGSIIDEIEELGYWPR